MLDKSTLHFMDISYNQESKNKSRELLISHAVRSLTVNRHESYMVSKDHFTKITDHFNEMMHLAVGPGNLDFHNTYNWLFHAKKDSWLTYYESVCKSMSAAELKVLYLSGPEPLNDIEVLSKHGIRLENIWAIESDKEIYKSAFESLKENGVHIKLHRGKLEEFFEHVNHEFDIIYFDACSPIISSKDCPLEVLKQIFVNRRLSGLSALVTNFAEPGDNLNWGDILGSWFATKYEYEVPQVDFDSGLENYMKESSFTEYSSYVNKHLLEYYDTFITHFIAAFAAEIIPMWQMTSLQSLQNRFLLIDRKLNTKLNDIRQHKIKPGTIEEIYEQIPHFNLATDSYPLLNWARLSKEHLMPDHPINRFLKSQRKHVTVEDALYIGSLLKQYESTNSGFKTFIKEVCSQELQELLDNIDFFDRELRITCDIPMKNIFVELLYGLYSFPYVANSKMNMSLKYRAKSKLMFSNVFIFDQCRYMFDFLPTPDLWPDFFNNYSNQTVVRACVDEIRRKHISLNSSLFKWGFIEDVHSYGFTKEELQGRMDLTVKKGK